jgi:hypothetical protein
MSAADDTTFMTPDEIREMTKKQRYTAQRRALNALGISCKVRADGRQTCYYEI